MKSIKVILAIALAAVWVFGLRCSNKKTEEIKEVKDVDGNSYAVVKIGDQWWMAQNIQVTHYRNGDPIRYVPDSTEWGGLLEGAYCAYNNDKEYVSTYGYLYNWYAVIDPRGFAPEGWHVPSDADWKRLERNLGMSRSQADSIEWRGTAEGGKLKATGTWYWENYNTGATNESGFSALPGGLRDFYGQYYSLGSLTYYWTSTQSRDYGAWYRHLYRGNANIQRSRYPEYYGLSVRCIK